MRKEELASTEGWWHQFLEDDQLDNIELGSKMILLRLMDILKECEMIGVCSAWTLSRISSIRSTLRRTTMSVIWALGSMDGSTQPEQRKRWCNYFNDAKNHQMRLFLISTKAGGLGINFRVINHLRYI